MHYYIDKKTGIVCAYDEEQLSQVFRLTELERLLQVKEPIFINASDQLQLTESGLKEAQLLLEQNLGNPPEDEALNNEYEGKLQELQSVIDEKTVQYNNALVEFENINAEYLPLKAEYEEILPVFFDIRENLKVMKKMTSKEVDVHLNPPISKEQLIAEAEQKKQALLAEANNAIAPLQDAVDLGMATDEEKAQLTAWKTYRVLLNRVDTSTAPDIDWPEKPL